MSVDSVFARNGVLAENFSGYHQRSEQIAMAQAVNDALLDGGKMVLEAGTGIGKTFAYLVPILESNQSAMISTGARALQDQLLQRDIPLLTKTLQRPVDVAVLKGRANYVCKLALSENNGGKLAVDADSRRDWQAVVEFSRHSPDGDIRGASDIAADSPIWQDAVSTRDSCPVHACQYHDNGCFLYAARRRAQRADIVIVNHHLFLSDMRLKDEGVAEILPTRDVLLFDEAHLLPKLAVQYFGERLSAAELIRLINDAERTASEHCQDSTPVITAGNALRRSLQNIPPLPDNSQETRLSINAVQQNRPMLQAMEKMRKKLAILANALQERAGNATTIEKLAARAKNAELFLDAWLSVDTNEENDTTTVPTIRWWEQKADKFTALHSAPISGRDIFAKLWNKTQTVLFTSATLSVSGKFDDFCEEMGLQDAQTKNWESPYDFANRTALYIPQNLPNPNDSTHTQKFVAAALPLIRANYGGAFVLFSSHRALAEADALLRDLLTNEGFTVFKQGDMSNDELLQRFRLTPRSVLLGSQSFWQGVDVKGDALSLVVVDKIPFSPPGDPILTARDNWRKQRGEEPFLHNQLPAAAILMKQVAGRLMRDENDYGIFMVGDKRLQTRGYGKKILRSLPPMRHYQNEHDVIGFLRTFSPNNGHE